MSSGTPRPTGAELNLLRALWRHGPSTVREVLDELTKSREVGYTTVLKLLQIMTEKGLVVRDESRRTHVYKARLNENQTQKQLVKDLLDRAYAGAAGKLVMHALESKKADKAELEAIRRLLDEMEKK